MLMSEKYLYATAFAPGHITGFFGIHDTDMDLRKCGSVGAGICLSKGCLSTVIVKKETKKSAIEVYLNGKKSEAQTTATAIKNLAEKEGQDYGNYTIRVENTVQLPIRQGFGMSGAGALSSVLAFARAMDMSVMYYDVVEAAHKAEIQCKTGLGDVVAQAVGGITVRKKPGLPPYGFVDNLIEPKKEIILAVIGREVETKKILSNKKARDLIEEQSAIAVNQLRKNPSLDTLIYLSHEFALKTELMDAEIKKALDEIKDLGNGSVSMLGRSIFVVPYRNENKKKIISKLKKYGEIYACDVDNCGARYV